MGYTGYGGKVPHLQWDLTFIVHSNCGSSVIKKFTLQEPQLNIALSLSLKKAFVSLCVIYIKQKYSQHKSSPESQIFQEFYCTVILALTSFSAVQYQGFSFISGFYINHQLVRILAISIERTTHFSLLAYHSHLLCAKYSFIWINYLNLLVIFYVGLQNLWSPI